MGYSTRTQVEQILASALTSGTTSSMPVNIINVGNDVKDTVDPDTFIQYIRWADEEIDSALSVIYKTPLKRIVKGEYEILANIGIGDTTVFIEDSTRFNAGDMIVLTDRVDSEKKIIDTITSETELEVTLAFATAFLASDTIVQRIGYPDPIPLCSARFAAASLYDKFFSAQANPNVSDYGKNLRNMAENDFNSVLNGRTRLHGEKILGRRFFNPNLLDVNAVASGDKNRGTPQ
jgi:hypothetical protein